MPKVQRSRVNADLSQPYTLDHGRGVAKQARRKPSSVLRIGGVLKSQLLNELIMGDIALHGLRTETKFWKNSVHQDPEEWEPLRHGLQQSLAAFPNNLKQVQQFNQQLAHRCRSAVDELKYASLRMVISYLRGAWLICHCS